MGLILLIIQPFLMAASAANPAVIATGKYISHGRTLNTQFCQENNHAVTDKEPANTGLIMRLYSKYRSVTIPHDYYCEGKILLLLSVLDCSWKKSVEADMFCSCKQGQLL